MNENTLPDNYWIKLLANEKVFNEVRLFKYNDISLKARTKEEIVELVKERFGSGTKKIQNEEFIKSVAKEHERIRTNLKKETAVEVVALYTELAVIAGLETQDGGGFTFRKIAQSVRKKQMIASYLIHTYH